jgi:hypothetical protein
MTLIQATLTQMVLNPGAYSTRLEDFSGVFIVIIVVMFPILFNLDILVRSITHAKETKDWRFCFTGLIPVYNAFVLSREKPLPKPLVSFYAIVHAIPAIYIPGVNIASFINPDRREHTQIFGENGEFALIVIVLLINVVLLFGLISSKTTRSRFYFFISLLVCIFLTDYLRTHYTYAHSGAYDYDFFGSTVYLLLQIFTLLHLAIVVMCVIQGKRESGSYPAVRSILPVINLFLISGKRALYSHLLKVYSYVGGILVSIFFGFVTIDALTDATRSFKYISYDLELAHMIRMAVAFYAAILIIFVLTSYLIMYLSNRPECRKIWWLSFVPFLNLLVVLKFQGRLRGVLMVPTTLLPCAAIIAYFLV